jgi:hypothetical protein
MKVHMKIFDFEQVVWKIEEERVKITEEGLRSQEYYEKIFYKNQIRNFSFKIILWKNCIPMIYFLIFLKDLRNLKR